MSRVVGATGTRTEIRYPTRATLSTWSSWASRVKCFDTIKQIKILLPVSHKPSQREKDEKDIALLKYCKWRP